MTQVGEYVGPAEIEKVISACSNPRDEAFIALLARTGIRISEAIALKTSDIDFQRGILTILHLKEKSRLKCPHCGDGLGKRHVFCPGCGNRVGQAVREKIEQRRQRTIPIDSATLGLIEEYLEWRRKFHSLRHLLATTWVGKGLDVKKLQVLLGHASIATTMEYVDSNFEQLRSEYEKLWKSKEDGTEETKN
jgi:integrase